MLIVLLAVAACSDSENDTTDATPEPPASTVFDTEPPPTVAVVATPQATNEQRIAAALDQLAADVAGDEPISPSIDSLIAYDVMDTTVNPETGDVTITICGWPEGTVFDTVRDSLYSIKTNPDGTVTATHRTSPTGPGECLNTELINTALDHIDEFEVYWASVVADPSTYDSEAIRGVLVDDGFATRSEVRTGDWVRDEVYFVRPFLLEGDVRSQAAADLLYRRYIEEDLEILELVVCREMVPESGMYRGGTLLDSSRPTVDAGPHSISLYQLVPSPDVGGQLLIGGTSGLSWAHCLRGGDWPGGANEWRPRSTMLTVLDQ